MDRAAIQAHISKGFAKAALVVGQLQTHYRPLTSFNPVFPGSSAGMLFCAFDYSPSLTLIKPTPVDHPFALLIADLAAVQLGDYLVGENTYFVSRVESLRPAWCVLCNMTMNILDTAQATSAGTNGYGGVTNSTNTVVATGWPMSVLCKTKGAQDTTKLPSDTRSVFYEVLLPPIPGVTLGPGLCLQDSESKIYEIMSAELTEYGGRLMVGLATT